MEAKEEFGKILMNDVRDNTIRIFDDMIGGAGVVIPRSTLKNLKIV